MAKSNNLFRIILLSLTLTICLNCSQHLSQEINPAAEGFLIDKSDSTAIAIADDVMEAMGGREAWDNTRYLHWNFFGSRKLLWDRKTGKVRIKSIRNKYEVLLDSETMTGTIEMDSGRKVPSDSVSFYLNKAKEILVNDSYWLIMPFKLKDSGVALKYVSKGVDSLSQYDMLSLTFESVGYTPDNKYHVYVHEDSKRIERWDFYTNASDSTYRFTTSWENYKNHNGVLLSGDRGGDYQLSEIAVPYSIPAGFMENLENKDWTFINKYLK